MHQEDIKYYLINNHSSKIRVLFKDRQTFDYNFELRHQSDDRAKDNLWVFANSDRVKITVKGDFILSLDYLGESDFFRNLETNIPVSRPIKYVSSGQTTENGRPQSWWLKNKWWVITFIITLSAGLIILIFQMLVHKHGLI